MERSSWAQQGIDLERPSVARVYDYFLGGAHNFAVDRQLAEAITGITPAFGDTMRAQPGVPAPGGAVPGRRRRHPVPGHRVRHPDRGQRARDRPPGRPVRARGLRRHRPHCGVAQSGDSGRRPAHRGDPGRRPGHRPDPGGPGDHPGARPRPAGRGAAGRGAGLRAGRARPGRHRRAGCGTRSARAATWPWSTRPTRTSRPTWWRRRSCWAAPAPRSTCAPAASCSTSSPG